MREMNASRFIREENDAITIRHKLITMNWRVELVMKSKSKIVIHAMKAYVQPRTFQQNIDRFSHVSQTKRHFKFLWNSVCPCHKKVAY